MFSSLKIGTKLLLTIGLTFVLGFGVLIFIIGTNVNTDMVESISKTLRSEVKAQTNFVSANFHELSSLTENKSSFAPSFLWSRFSASSGKLR